MRGDLKNVSLEKTIELFQTVYCARHLNGFVTIQMLSSAESEAPAHPTRCRLLLTAPYLIEVRSTAVVIDLVSAEGKTTLFVRKFRTDLDAWNFFTFLQAFFDEAEQQFCEAGLSQSSRTVLKFE